VEHRQAKPQELKKTRKKSKVGGIDQKGFPWGMVVPKNRRGKKNQRRESRNESEVTLLFRSALRGTGGMDSGPHIYVGALCFG